MLLLLEMTQCTHVHIRAHVNAKARFFFLMRPLGARLSGLGDETEE